MLAKIRHYRPSHTTVVAYLALFVALGGTSFAAVRLSKNSVRSKHITNEQVRSVDVRNASLLAQDFAPGQLPQGPQGERGPAGADATSLWAVVEEDGTLARGEGAVASSKVPGTTGRYTVQFNRDITNCAYQATPERIVSEIAVESEATSPPPDTTSVVTRTPDGSSLVDRKFHLAVFC